jgi:hypothetical protein
MLRARCLHERDGRDIGSRNDAVLRTAELPQGTHSVMMETHRFALFDAVQKFLDEGGR